MKKLFVLFLLNAVIAAHGQTITGVAPVVKTSNGLLRGTGEGNGICSFKGIPYAQPPIGDLRWKEPQPPQKWTGIRAANKFGPQAMQRFIYSDMKFRSAGKSEDCLYLNVWTPAKTAAQKLPVMVYFYGGGFQAGDGSEYRYDGESMAKKGIVSVTINYRLGIFGFMAHPGLTSESVHHASGNYGLLDQHAALVWVQKNIAAFGGDPAKVTIAGESAGSMSVCGQVASPLSKGLFRAAIGESGSLLGNLTPVPLNAAEKNGEAFAVKVGAKSLADLRNIPADSLLQWAAGMRFSPDVDGYFLPVTPQEIFNAGKQMKVPLLAGWNSAESDYRGLLGQDAPTLDNYKKALQKLYEARAGDVLKAYPAATDADVPQAATNLAADRFIAYATWKFTYMQGKTSGQPVYRYFFSRKRPSMVNPPQNGKAMPMGAVHSAEIEYALGNLSTNKVYNWTADDYKVSALMESYFANFIKKLNPNGPGLPGWVALQNNAPKTMVIDVLPHQIAVNDAHYAVMDSFFNQ